MDAMECRERILNRSTAAAVTLCTSTTAGCADGLWTLLYTTEADVHRLTALPGAAPNVTQRIALPAAGAVPRVTNRIELRPGWGLEAGGPLTVSTAKRLVYRFDYIALLVARIRLTLPLGTGGPGGWSDQVFCDGATRVVRNSRGDLLVLARAAGGGDRD